MPLNTLSLQTTQRTASQHHKLAPKAAYQIWFMLNHTPTETNFLDIRPTETEEASVNEVLIFSAMGKTSPS